VSIQCAEKSREPIIIQSLTTEEGHLTGFQFSDTRLHAFDVDQSIWFDLNISRVQQSDIMCNVIGVTLDCQCLVVCYPPLAMCTSEDCIRVFIGADSVHLFHVGRTININRDNWDELMALDRFKQLESNPTEIVATAVSELGIEPIN
jgi:hypothetical protein